MRTLARHKREINGAAAAAAAAAAASAAASYVAPRGGGGGGGSRPEGFSIGSPVDITPDGFILPADR